MKNLFTLSILLLLALSSSAQFKVNSTGQVFIQKNIQSGYEMVGIGSVTDYDQSYYNDYYRIGLHVQKGNTISGKDCVGIYSETLQSTTGNSSVGVYGYGRSSSNGRNYGVAGTIDINANGAAIAGTTEGALPPYFNGNYAGYFYGDCYTDGSITATYGLYNLSDMRLKDNIVSLSEHTKQQGGTLQCLKDLEVFSYNLKRPQANTEVKRNDKVSEQKARDAKRLHYGVSAQELQKIFPDLVREGQDGYLTVNYTEMVPLLLKCIQELKEQVDGLQEQAETVSMSRRSLATFEDEANEAETETTLTAAIPMGAMLYQNTPNPFSERTTIRFSLPDEAQNAFIYIFDMQGKMQKQIPVSPAQSSVTINGYELPAGMYIYSLVVNGKEIGTKRMILSK